MDEDGDRGVEERELARGCWLYPRGRDGRSEGGG